MPVYQFQHWGMTYIVLQMSIFASVIYTQMHKNIIPSLKEKLNLPLPGWSAQKFMSPVSKEKYTTVPDHARQAGVLIVLYPDASDLHIIYIKRTDNNPNDKHRGQISFPGGKKEPSDASLLDTALRECHEEIGIAKNELTVLGPLSPINVYVSNFYVQPYVAFTDEKPQYILQESEVDQVIEKNMAELFLPENKKEKDLKIRNTTLHNIPYYALDHHTLWGATAMITSELEQVILSL